MTNLIEIYTDGSVVNNDGLFCGSGWALIIPERQVEKSGKEYYLDEAIPRLELMAVVEALKYITQHKGDYVIYCDSKSTVYCFKGYGSRKLYKELWNEAHALVKQILLNNSSVSIEFLNTNALDKESKQFKYAQTVDRLAYIQANSLEIR